MAEDITDVYVATEAGDAGWQSLSALAAAQVEAELPISSADGSVTLDAPSANTFIVSTGGAERVAVSTTDATFSVPVRTSTVKGVADTGAQIDLGGNFSVSTGGEERLRVNQLGCLGVKTTDTAFSSTYGIVDARANDSQTLSDQIDSSSSILATNSTTYSLRNVAVGDGTYAGFASRVTNSLGTHQTAGFACEAVGSGFSPNMVWVSRSSSTASKKQMVLDSSGNLRIENGHLQTTTVKGVADTDAQIDLGSELRTTNHTPTQPDSIATKKIVDDKIWVGTTAEYLAIPGRDILPTTLYCLTD